jgi:hypothetical protein
VEAGVCAWCAREIGREFPGKPITVNQGPAPAGTEPVTLQDQLAELTPFERHQELIARAKAAEASRKARPTPRGL